MNAGETRKDNFLTQIWSLCTTFTEEAMAVAFAKAKELGFDPDRGLVPLPESFINLSSARSIVEDAIEKQKLVQLPITVQKEILTNLETISKSLQGLSSGVDEVVNLTSAIEVLNTAIWKYGLHNLSDQVLGYQKKLNQLKNQELQISKIMTQLDAANSAIEKANSAAAATEQQKNSAAALLEQVKQGTASSASLLEQVKEASTKTAALFATIQQNEKQSGELVANIKTSNNELSALDSSIKKFYSEVDEYRKKITQTSDEASKLITTSEAAVKKLVEDTTTRAEDVMAGVKTDSQTALEDLASKIDAKIKQDEESLSALTSTVTTNVTTFQTGVEAKLSEALSGLHTASSNLITQSQ